MKVLILLSVLVPLLTVSCATIVNDPNIPISVSFSDGSSGTCDFRNKRGLWSTEIPTNGVMIRRSDDALIYNCLTDDGRRASGSVQSETEGGKMAASVIFWDLGITDAITDKHRTYLGNLVIPIEKATVTPPAATVSSKGGVVQECVDACVNATSKSQETCFDICIDRD